MNLKKPRERSMKAELEKKKNHEMFCKPHKHLG
jgi:hypothetical protein